MSAFEKLIQYGDWSVLDQLGCGVWAAELTALLGALQQLPANAAGDLAQRFAADPALLRQLIGMPLVARANQRALSLIGVDDQLPCPLDKLLRLSTTRGVDVLMAAFVAREPSACAEVDVLGKDGRERHLLVDMRFNYDGESAWCLSSFVDTGALGATDQRLLESNRFLDAIVENIPDMIFVKDARDLTFVRFNKAGETLLGYRREELIGKSDHDFFPAEEADFFTANDRDVLRSGELLEIPLEPIETRDHGLRWLRTKKIPINDAQGQPRYLLGISEDITDETRYREQAQRLRSIFEHAAIPMVICDAEGLLTTPNQAFLRLHRCDGTRIRGLHFRDLLVDTDRERSEQAFSRLLETDHISLDVTHRRCDGTTLPVLVDIVVMRDVAQRVEHLFATVHDLSELERTRSALERRTIELEVANRHKSQFLATMSHELRTPLNAVLGFAEILKEGLAGDLTERQREYISDIYSSGERLLSMIDDILDLSRMDDGSSEVKPEMVFVPDLCARCLSIHSTRAQRNGATLSVSYVDLAAPIYLDGCKYQQILTNLVSNAIKFTPDGGNVSVEVRRVVENDRDDLETTVCDTGIGIADADISKLFHAFVQLDASLTRRYQGAGLGLALVERLTRQLGGTVSVDSREGAGSCFRVVIPWRSQADVT